MTNSNITPEDLTTYNQALDRAVLHLFQRQPGKSSKTNPSTFITTIFAGLRKQWDFSNGTAWVDGLVMGINPLWFMSLSESMRCTLLAHETWHVAFMHGDRRGDRCPDKWNQAADHAINLMLEEFGFVFDTDPATGKKMGLLDPRFKDMSAEQIYDILIQEALPNQPIELPFGSDIRDSGDGEEGGESSGQKAATQSAVTGLIVRAMTLSQMSGEAGSIPGYITEQVDKLLNPVLPWYVLLSRYLNERSEEGFSWRSPNRRYLCNGLYLPSPGGQEGLEHTLWGCDVSGSMSSENLVFMNSEMKGVKERLHPKTMKVVSFDTEIHDIWEFTGDDSIGQLEFNGRGGTDLFPLFEIAKKEKPNLLVVLSDLECLLPPQPDNVPVLWIRVGNEGQMPSYGHVINVDR